MGENPVKATQYARSPALLGRMAALAVVLLFPVLLGAAEAPFRAVTDNLSYNAGEIVRLRVIPSHAAAGRSNMSFLATLRYAGEGKPILDRVPLMAPDITSADNAYRTLWKVPSNAKTGRYEIDLTLIESLSRKQVGFLPSAASFAVHRKLVRIERIELGKTFYTPGDPVSCRAVLKNLTDRPLTGLRVEFSERYWPWIAPTPERVGMDVFPLVKELTLKPKAELEVRSERAASAKNVAEGTVQQYAVVVWDRARKMVHDIAFSPLTIIQPAGGSEDRPYPLQYVFPKLSGVDTRSYRQFARSADASGAIRFDSSHTMFAPGDLATVKFSVTNDTDHPWENVTVRASLGALGGAEFARETIAENVDLGTHSKPLEKEAKFRLPAEGAGSYRVVAEVISSQAEVLAANQIELAANPMPKSILVFCAHEDDEMLHAGMIRAAVENHIPIHLVYFTSGDAGSCDRYYQHSCSPAEALHFGTLRMAEARAALGHLGVPRENIHFLGLPDGGSGEIWRRHIAPSHPYLSVLLASDHAPYEGLEKPNLPYARRAVVDAVKEFITRLGPDVIYTGHPDERHVDHRTNNWFVVEALRELLRTGQIAKDLELRVDQTYGPGTQKLAPYRYEKHILWVTPEARALAQEASWFYQSQSGNRNLGKIRPLDQLPRQEIHWRVLDWNEHEGWNEKD